MELTEIQAVKYTTKTNYGLDDGLDARDSNSEMDEDFVNNGSADDTDDAMEGVEHGGVEMAGKANGTNARKPQDHKAKGTTSKAKKTPTPRGESKKSKSKAVDTKSQSKSLPPTPQTTQVNNSNATSPSPRTPQVDNPDRKPQTPKPNPGLQFQDTATSKNFGKESGVPPSPQESSCTEMASLPDFCLSAMTPEAPN